MTRFEGLPTKNEPIACRRVGSEGRQISDHHPAVKLNRNGSGAVLSCSVNRS